MPEGRRIKNLLTKFHEKAKTRWIARFRLFRSPGEPGHTGFRDSKTKPGAAHQTAPGKHPYAQPVRRCGRSLNKARYLSVKDEPGTNARQILPLKVVSM